MMSAQTQLHVRPDTVVQRHEASGLLHRCARLVRRWSKPQSHDEAARLRDEAFEHARAHRWSEAIDALAGYITLRPEDAVAAMELASIYAAHDRWHEAITVLSDSALENPIDASLFYDLGVVYRKLEMFTYAIAAFKRVLALQPGNDPARHALESTLAIVRAERTMRDHPTASSHPCSRTAGNVADQ